MFYYFFTVKAVLDWIKEMLLFLLYYFVIGEIIRFICYLNAPKHLKCNAVFMYKNITFSTLMMLDNDLASPL